jgi:hypothetical protein
MSAKAMIRVLGMTAVLVACTVSPADAVERPARQRVTFTLSAAGGVTTIAEAGVLPRSGLIVRLAVESAKGATGAEWTVAVLRGGRADGAMLARLDGRDPVLEVPRPLGIEVAAGEPIRLEIASAPGQELRLTVVFEYEAAGGEGRIPVRPLHAAADGEESGWAIVPAVTGRLMALAGLRLEHGAELHLRNTGTGVTVWREVVPAADARGFSAAGDVVRVGALLHEGHSYRLTIVVPDGPGDPATGRAPLLLSAALPAARRD